MITGASGVYYLGVQSVSPAGSGDASNGLSVDPVSGDYVLGNDVGDPAAPAQLLSNREILTADAAGVSGPFSVTLNDAFNQATTAMNGSTIDVAESAGFVPALFRATSNGLAGASLVLQESGVRFRVLTNATDCVITSGNFNIGVMRFQQVNPFGVHFHANSGNAYNSATVQISGTLTNRVVVTSVGAVTLNIDRDLDSNKFFINSNAAVLALPNMSGSNARNGFNIRVAVNNAAGVTIQLAAGQICRMGASVTSSGGTLSSVTVGSFIRIYSINSATWVAGSLTGSWAFT